MSPVIQHRHLGDGDANDAEDAYHTPYMTPRDNAPTSAGVYNVQDGAARAAAAAAASDVIVDVEAAAVAMPVFSWRKLLLHMGPGFLMCIAFVDPGNLEADLQAGALTGYSLLWVLLWSTGMGFLLQSLAARLGVATGRHLAQHCREQYPAYVRLTLWLMAEVAIIGSDVQECIGTAIALLMLTGGALPLAGGVAVAAVAAYVLLFLEKLGVRWLEASFQAMVAVMCVTMGALFFMAGVNYAGVAEGLLVPRISAAGLPTAAGLLGAILMPHNLYLHSALVHARPLGDGARRIGRAESIRYYTLEAALALGVTLFINTAVISVFARGFYGRRAGRTIGLENAGRYLGKRFGASYKAIWAVGLLAAGQSSTMTGTYAGQWVMGGFLDLRVPLFTRALITRAVAICPAMVVALSAGADSTKLDALNQWLNILQAVQLPFAVVPLLTLTSNPAVMGARFVTSRGMAAACWVIAGGIAVVNGGAAYQTAAAHLPPGSAVHAAFWAGVALYFCMVGYLVLHPRLPPRWRDRKQPAGGAHAEADGRQGGGGRRGGLEEPLLQEAAPLPPPPAQQRPWSPARQMLTGPPLPSHPVLDSGSMGSVASV